MKLYFTINYATEYGKNLSLKVLDEKKSTSYKMEFSGSNNWKAEIDFFSRNISYKYQLINDQGEVLDEEIPLHRLNFVPNIDEYEIRDVWNNRNFPENYLNNKILHNILSGLRNEKIIPLRKHTHLFRLEAPLYSPNWRVYVLGADKVLGNWDVNSALPMRQTQPGIWEGVAELNFEHVLEYKYAIFDEVKNELIGIEYGGNRLLPANNNGVLLIQADHFFRFSAAQLYRAAGVAIPVFSLKSETGFGVGEFRDLKKLADWNKKAGLSIIQILPINDTTASYTWTDSYPYAAISVYALHPLYISLENLDFPIPKELHDEYQKDKWLANEPELLDYEKVIAGKWKYLNAVFEANKTSILRDRNFLKFYKEKCEWLKPYAAFSVLRDKYSTPDFNQWKTHKKYVAGKLETIFTAKHPDYETAMKHIWVQYQLHLQLKDAVNYAHSLGISLKGDLPIGIFRHSVEAWAEPQLFGMDFQAGAPPDEFTDLGQNWGFPTYNWEVMQADGFTWWKKRFRAIAEYFDAMRIDHILGFFRIWRMPMSAVQGILGYFYPAVPVRTAEFEGRQIPFNFSRYCKPFINDQILWDLFGGEKENLAAKFLNSNENGTYTFKEEFDTQRKLAHYFEKNPLGWVEEKLLELAANVLFLSEETEGETVFHPRFNIQKTSSYHYLSDWEKQQLYDLYIDYFFRRQDKLWAANAMEKLPALLTATDMLICGEDLGLVPDCVPEVMDNLAIAALKVQRSPKENIPFYNPQTAGYLNVVTASSHDSSTLRQWWHENRDLTQQYYNQQLNQYGAAPWDLTPELSEIILKQHLHSEAMLCIFPLQEFFATSYETVNPNMDNERINNPANFPHYWRYRMHLTLEELLQKEQFINTINWWVKESKRL